MSSLTIIVVFVSKFELNLFTSYRSLVGVDTQRVTESGGPLSLVCPGKGWYWVDTKCFTLPFGLDFSGLKVSNVYTSLLSLNRLIVS